MKTIAELNSHWWYRTLKVLYIILFLFIYLFYFNYLMDEMAPYKTTDSDKSSVTCLDGNMKQYTYTQLGEQSGVTNAVIMHMSPEEIAQLCDLPDAYGNKITESTSSSYIPVRERIQQNLDNKDKIDLWGKQTSEKIKYNEVEKTVGSYSSLILVCAVAFFVLILFFEVLRRIFYYIILGTIRPPKK